MNRTNSPPEAVSKTLGNRPPELPGVPGVSVVVINWNTRDMTLDCLASVFEHTRDVSVEVIVVDNASTDGSAQAIAQRFPQVTLIANRENRGFAAANNQAMRQARGRYWLLLNSDTLVLDAVIAASARYLDEHADVGAMGCRVLNDDRTVQLTCSRYPTLANLLLLTSGLWKLNRPRWLGRYAYKHWQRDSERDVDTVSGCYLMARRQACEQVGLFDEAFFFFGEETDWCRRFREAGWRVAFSPVGEIVHYGSVSARKLNHRRDIMLTQAMVRLHRKHAGVAAALAAYVLLMGFNLSRMIFWQLTRLTDSPRAKERARHFTQVVAHARECWAEKG